jgi:hypothetical protein
MSAFIQTQEIKPFDNQPPTLSLPAGQVWTGRVLTGLVGAFMLFDGGAKLFKVPAVVQVMLQLGYTETAVAGIGLALVVSTILYLVPRTAFIGAILLSAYLGGAVDANVRTHAPVFNIVFAVLFGVLAWAGLALRSQRLRSMLAK